jgi:hypothetical protein
VVPAQEVLVGSQLTLNLTLEVGAAVQTVEVKAAPGAELQTLNSTMSTTVSGDTLLLLPSTDRDVASVLYFVPTVAPNFHGAEGNFTAGQVAGMTSDQNTYMLDGGNNTSGLEGDNAYVNGGHGVIPMPMESISEFKVNTNNPTSDFNSSSGAEVLLTTKRGTNAWHGSAYDYYQGGALNSNDWSNNREGIRKSPAHSNRFGGAVGGPMTPSFAGGKTYFYVNYEGNRYPRSSPQEWAVPSVLLRQGILQLRDATGTPVQYDLATSTQCGYKTDAQGNITGPANLICDPRGPVALGGDGTMTYANGVNPVVNGIWQKYMPLPQPATYTGCTDLNSQCYLGNMAYPLSDNFFLARLDHDFGSKWRAFVSYRWFKENNADTSQIDIGGLLPGDTMGQFASASSTPLQPRYFVLGATGNLTPAVTNEFHMSFTRGFWQWKRAGAVPEVPGIPGALEFGESGSWIPLNVNTQSARARLWDEHDWDFRDTLSWIRGNHFFQFGGDVMHQWWHFDRYDDVVSGLTQLVYQMANVDNNPVMTPPVQPFPCVTATSTNCLPSQFIGSWNGYYANLLGMIGESAIVISRSGVNLTPNPLGTPAHSWDIVPTYSIYFSDAWHIRPNLTLTYGLNYGVQMPPYETTGAQDIMTDAAGAPINAESYLHLKESYANNGQIYDPPFGYVPIKGVGPSGGWKYPYSPFYGGWGPRVALAYSPPWDSGWLGKLFGHKSTVIRGGYSRMYDRSLAIILVSDPILGDGFLQPIACIGGTIGGACTGSSGTTPSNIFRIGIDGNVAPLGAIAPTLPTPVMPGINGTPPESLAATLDNQYRPGSSDQIDFTIQRQLKGGMILELGYVGRWAKHQYAGIDINDVPWMMKQGGQTFAQAWSNLVWQTVYGTGIPPAQPWFETALGGVGSKYCAGFKSCTAAVENYEAGNIATDAMTPLWADLDSSFVFGPNTIPFMNQDSWTDNDTSMGYSNYQAFVATLTKRVGQGLSFNFNATYGHSIGEFNMNQMYTLANPENPFNLRTDYSDQPWDRKFTMNWLGTYELPFGPGRRWASSNPVVKRLIGGWSLTPIFTWASGLPEECLTGTGLEWGNGWDPWYAGCVPLGNVLKFGNSPHVIGNYSSSVAENDNPANGGIGINMFAHPDQVINSLRYDIAGIDGRSYDYGPIRGQKRWNLDLTLTKDTQITERVGFQVFMQAFNLFNHQQWGDPYLNLQDPADWGAIYGQYGAMGNGYTRIIQLGARVHF